jgi:predicted aldo/keto reductase-like oxidoreductase
MRFPTVDGEMNRIDEEKTAEIVAYAMKNGVNYYDTAWGYHGGQSETVMGKILAKYPRDSFYLADKFPGYDLSTFEKKEEIFEKQLEKCQVDYFDFYLFHNVCEKNIEQFLDPKYDIYGYLTKKKNEGKIKHLGFSTHGSLDTIKRFLDAYGDSMEFCQIQLNWLDYEFQNAKAKIELLKEYNIPIWVMEPVRGGRLITLPEKHIERLKTLNKDRSLPEWAFRFLQSIDGVVVSLSGMSNMQQLTENIATYKEKQPLTKEEFDTLIDIAKEMTSKDSVPCTACKYCVSYCPKQLNIPWLLELYNEHNYSNGGFIAHMALSSLDDDKKPSACIGCRSCEAVCPQRIKISEALAKFAEKTKK